jgi:hypothetical protein
MKVNNISAVLGSALLTTGFVSMLAIAPATASVTCSVTDVSLGAFDATDCRGSFEGNDTGAGSTLLDSLNAGLFSSVPSDVTWSLAGKSDDSNPLVLRADEKLLLEGGLGAWNLTSALSTDTFVLSLKAGTSYSAYLFQGIDFLQSGLDGLFTTMGVALDGSGLAGRDLSHASLFVASRNTGTTPVPEPATLLGLAVVGGGISLSRRRKSPSC